jgi:hypothetical protein
MKHMVLAGDEEREWWSWLSNETYEDVKECWRKELEEIKKGYNRHFMCKKSRAGHVCTAPSDVNDGNGRRG